MITKEEVGRLLQGLANKVSWSIEYSMNDHECHFHGKSDACDNMEPLTEYNSATESFEKLKREILG